MPHVYDKRCDFGNQGSAPNYYLPICRCKGSLGSRSQTPLHSLACSSQVPEGPGWGLAISWFLSLGQNGFKVSNWPHCSSGVGPTISWLLAPVLPHIPVKAPYKTSIEVFYIISETFLFLLCHFVVPYIGCMCINNKCTLAIYAAINALITT